MKRKINMKKITTITLCVVFAAVFLTACVSINFSPFAGSGITGRGSLETFTFNVGEINEVRVELFCNIVYRSAPSDTVTLQIQPNLMEYVNVQESGGILTVNSTRNINIANTANAPVLTVSSPSLTRISHAGAGNLTTADPIVTDTFTLNISGAANGSVSLDVHDLSLNITGAGNLTLNGTAVNADISMAGAGRLEALGLQTAAASISMAGAGSVRISCSDSLSISAGGVGTVEYRGSPTLDITRGGFVTVKQVD